MRRTVLKSLAAALGGAAATRASAQSWPSARPIRIVVAFGPGSASDLFARMLGTELSKSLRQSIVVENRPGASGVIAAEHVANAPPDGYTLFLTTNTTHSANPFLLKSLRYDPVRDFTPLVRVADFPFAVLVNAESGIRTVQDLVAFARTNPGKATYAYTSSAGQIAAAALSNAMKMDAVGVAYKAAPEAITSVIGEQVTFTVLDLATTQASVRSGRLRPLAVTADARTSLAPTLPTLAEEIGLKDFGVVAWMGMFGPANLPAPVVDRLSAELLKLLALPEIQERIVAMGAEPTPAGPPEFGAFVRRQLAVWERQIRIAGMQPQ